MGASFNDGSTRKLIGNTILKLKKCQFISRILELIQKITINPAPIPKSMNARKTNVNEFVSANKIQAIIFGIFTSRRAFLRPNESVRNAENILPIGWPINTELAMLRIWVSNNQADFDMKIIQIRMMF